MGRKTIIIPLTILLIVILCSCGPTQPLNSADKQYSAVICAVSDGSPLAVEQIWKSFQPMEADPEIVMPETLTIRFFGTEYTLTYQKPSKTIYHAYDYYGAKPPENPADVLFVVNEKCEPIFFYNNIIYHSAALSNYTDAELESIVLQFLSEQKIDLTDYRQGSLEPYDKDHPERGILFEYVKYVSDISTTDWFNVGINYNGEIFFYNMRNYGKFGTTKEFDVDLTAAQSAIEKRLAEQFSDPEQYNCDEVIIKKTSFYLDNDNQNAPALLCDVIVDYVKYSTTGKVVGGDIITFLLTAD